MKHLNSFLVAALLILGVGVADAQNKNNPWAIGIEWNAVDTYPVGVSNSGRLPAATKGKFFDEYFNVNDHWNMVPSVSRVSVARYIGSGLTFTAAGSMNRINKVGDFRADDLSYYSVDGEIKYAFKDVLNSGWFDPFLGIGGGYTWVDDIGFGTANGILGIRWWLNDNWAINTQSTYKHAFEDDYGIIHFQHSAGVVFTFGGTDTDGDGIYDYEDECPETPGLPEFNGCPDTDGDGIEDRNDACPNTPGLAEYNGCPDTDGDGIPDPQDACPNEPGPAEFNGCPDSDGDGIQDSEDSCPNEAGLAEFNGCPDSDGDGVADPNDNCPNTPGLKSLAGCPDADGDGVADGDDNCPNEAGPAANNGCPWPDSDGDGVLDKDDQCPNEAGTVANNGCPEINPTEEVMATLNNYARTILFDTGKSSFKDETMPVLEAMTAIFKEYPKANFSIDGHTDSVGSSKSNQLLSERRANAVRDFLIANGINADRLTAVGYGEEKPIDDNATRAGRANNRRVEVTLKN